MCSLNTTFGARKAFGASIIAHIGKGIPSGFMKPMERCGFSTSRWRMGSHAGAGCARLLSDLEVVNKTLRSLIA
jgi:hypothetical protein